MNTDRTSLCKCGHPLVITKGFPQWIYCKNPPCDYVVLWRDWTADRITGIYSENRFAKDGPFKGHLHGDPSLIKITGIKPMYVDPNDTKEEVTNE